MHSGSPWLSVTREVGRRSGSVRYQYSRWYPEASIRWWKKPMRYNSPTPTMGKARSEAAFKISPASTPRPPE